MTHAQLAGLFFLVIPPLGILAVIVAAIIEQGHTSISPPEGQ